MTAQIVFLVALHSLSLRKYQTIFVLEKKMFPNVTAELFNRESLLIGDNLYEMSNYICNYFECHLLKLLTLNVYV